MQSSAGDVAEVSLLNIAVQVRLQSMFVGKWKRSSSCYAGYGSLVNSNGYKMCDDGQFLD